MHHWKLFFWQRWDSFRADLKWPNKPYTICPVELCMKDWVQNDRQVPRAAHKCHNYLLQQGYCSINVIVKCWTVKKKWLAVSCLCGWKSCWFPVVAYNAQADFHTQRHSHTQAHADILRGLYMAEKQQNQFTDSPGMRQMILKLVFLL